MKSSGWAKNGLVYMLILISLAAVLFNVFSPAQQPEEVDLSTVAAWAKAGDIQSLIVSGEDVKIVRLSSPEATSTRKEPDISLTETLVRLGVTPEQLAQIEFSIETPSQWGNWLALLGSLLPVLFVGVMFFVLMRQAQSGNNQAMSFGKSRARVFTGDKPTVTFEDVAGAEESKQELQEVVEFLKEPQKFTALGARIPKGVLLVGPPGTGKTLMAKAVSGEAGVPFFSISGSEFVEMFVGVGASRVRDLFEQAKRNSPCIVFVDEIDAVGRQRGAGLGGSHDEREQTLNQILVEMDGFDTDTNVIVLAATNRPDILDPALLRPGRFDRQVVMDRPDMNGRKAILEVHTRGKPLAADADLTVLAKQTPGFVGADLENLVNEAAILAARRNKRVIGMSELQEAVERVMAGPERKSRLMTPEEKRVIAFHETGHALVRRFLPHTDPVHKISIISRGMSAGYTMYLPKDDRLLQSREKFRDEIASMMGGRAAEKVIFDEIWTGAHNDLERATKLARKMVTEFGMSEKMGPLTFGQKEELIFLGREIGEQRNYSELVASQIDREVRAIMTDAYQRAHGIVTQYRALVERIAERLVETETLDAVEFEALIKDFIAPAPPTLNLEMLPA